MKKDKAYIEKAKPEDYQTIADIYNVYISLGNATMEEVLHYEKDIAAWVKKFHNREALYVLRKAGVVIGWGIIKRYSDRNGYRFSCETAIYLAASELRKGYGSMIKRYLITACRRMDYHHVIAKIFAINTASIEYNLKLGYTIVGRQKEIGFRNGKWQDVVIMQLVLD